ncbi:hypothetical protein FPZ12_029460 [Amycolatopsis acidicola]|uniref:TOMM leader peptide-binding protein n=1 Tax=Amycolatopsis acidicola TaxID=2596893 RepID=A0A5N0UV06_9PSEU|nr:ThiF family adenylyltransferase [Amycolatopsis acidicola]KAA9155525.1 hypothetical protein FPZ12_029460 [Amycolatopsis acidicola]
MNDHNSKVREPHLPKRPRLRPGLETFDRRPGEVQIGLDPRHALVATGLTPDLVKVMHRLDGSFRTDELFEITESENVEKLREILASLTRVGLIEEAWSPAGHGRVAGEVGMWSLRARYPIRDAFTRRAHSAVVLYGPGRLTIAIATQLAAAGVGHVQVETDGYVSEQDTGSGYLDSDIGRQRRLAAISAIQRVNPAIKARRLGRDRQPELAVLADSIVPAPEIVRMLVQEGVPHLPVRVREGLGIVGPLVYPGRSTCMRCADLHR